MKPVRTYGALPLSLVALALLPGCGAGVAAVAASASGDGGTSAQPAIAAFAIDDPKEPDEAAIRFTLSRPATIELLYQLPGGAPQRMQAAGENPRLLDAGLQTIPWNFALELGLEPGPAGSFKPGIQVFARIRGVLEEAREGENALTLGLGNDPPVIEVTSPAAEVGATVPITLRLGDTSSDLIDVRVEYDLAGGAEEWLPARSGGFEPDDPTLDPAITGVLAPEGGADLVFFWDTDFDLPDLERDVRLRFTPIDPVVEGEPALSAVFAIDNNAEPRVVLDGKALFAHSDRRRGIPISFQVFDDEGDDVQVVFQWRRPGEEFPPLPDDPAELAPILADPALRRAHRTCSEYPRIFEGRVVPLPDPTTIRLPEMGTTNAATLLADGLEGRRLEILRPTPLVPANEHWSANPLSRPVAALPVGEGLNAIVLDEPVPGSWRLQDLELATGVVVRTLATGAGTPRAAGFEERTGRVLVASELADAWQLQAVAGDAVDATPLLVASHDAATEATPLRGLLSIGTGVCLLTVGSSLVRVDYTNPATPRSSAIARNLEAPWGMARDPLDPRHIFLALSGRADRGVVRFELDKLRWSPIGPRKFGLPGETPITRPHAIAVDERANRLFALCEGGSERMDLLGVVLGTGLVFDNATFRSSIYRVEGQLASDVGTVATGPDGLLLVPCLRTSELLVSGGVEQEVTIAAYDPSNRTAAVDHPFIPELTTRSHWRIQAGLHRVHGLAGGRRRTFAWDSSDAISGAVFIRASPFASERGSTDELSIPFPLANALDADAVDLPVPAGFRVLVAADVNAAGRIGLVGTVPAASGDALATSFGILPGDVAQTVAVASVDLDDDGWIDIVSLRQALPSGLGFLALHYGTPTGIGQTAIRLDLPTELASPVSMEVFDSTGDSRLDVAVLDQNGSATHLWTFAQQAGRTFSSSRIQLNSLLAFSSIYGDVNGDGLIDIIGGTQFDSAIFLTIEGQLQTNPTQLIANQTPVDLGDYDGDGDLDLLTRSSADFSSSAYSWDVNEFTFRRRLPAGAFRWTDLDGDRDLDLMAGASFYYDNSDEDVMATMRAGGIPADLNADGRIDIVSNDTVVHQARPGMFEAESRSGVSGLAVDLNGDGMPDIVNAVGCRIEISTQIVPGFFDDRGTVVTVPAETCSVPALVVAEDLQGDGLLDLLWHGEGHLEVAYQLAAGMFGPGPSFPGAEAFTLGDIDSDGDIDVVTSAAEGAMALITGWYQEQATYSSLEIQQTSLFVSALAAGDIDADGDCDLLLLGEQNGPICVLFQEENDFLASELDGPNGGLGVPIQEAFVLDADRDGGPDIVISPVGGAICSSSAGSCGVWIGFQKSGGVLWQLVSRHDSGAGVADLDLDGYLDIAVPGGGVFRQVVPGVFDALFVSPVFSSQPSDIDGDGEVDLAGFDVAWNGH